jgi:hypothetical protein
MEKRLQSLTGIDRADLQVLSMCMSSLMESMHGYACGKSLMGEYCMGKGPRARQSSQTFDRELSEASNEKTTRSRI